MTDWAIEAVMLVLALKALVASTSGRTARTLPRGETWLD